MPKTVSYHEDVATYNRLLAEAAEKAIDEVQDETVKKWLSGIARQHRVHQRRHEGYASKLRQKSSSIMSADKADEIIDDILAECKAESEAEESVDNSNEELSSDDVRRLDAIIEEAQV